MAEEEAERGIGEDWLAVWIGLALVALSLAPLAGMDLLGWAVTTSIWTDPSAALAPVGQAYADFSQTSDEEVRSLLEQPG